MKCIARLQRESLPYQADSTLILTCLADLDWPILFDSGCRNGAPGFAAHGIDLIAALPVAKLYHRDHQLLFSQAGVDPAIVDPAVEVDPGQISAVIEHWLGKYQQSAEPAQPGPGWLGCLGYDAARLLTPGVRWHQTRPAQDSLALGFYPCVIITDHAQHSTQLVWLSEFAEHAEQLRRALLGSRDQLDAPLAPFRLDKPFAAQQTRPGYQAAFTRIQAHIQAGDCYQANLTQSFLTSYQGSALTAYRLLRRQHQSPMGGYFDCGTRQLLSLSPERFVRGVAQQWSTSPIKGTAPRGESPEQDRQLANELVNSTKNRAENVMIVDLLRNDLGRFAVPGSVKVPTLFGIESYSNVHHLVSTITAQRRSEISQWYALLQCFPGGSITGAPKLRAMEIIDQVENHYRDWYCGSLVMLSCSDYLDSSILIRSLVMQQGMVRCWAGGGIVADSDADSEYQESLTKITTFMACLEATLPEPERSANG